MKWDESHKSGMVFPQPCIQYFPAFHYFRMCCAFIFSESVWVSNSKKDPETLSMLLKSGEAKSPFEQKRVKEIKHLNTKVG